MKKSKKSMGIVLILLNLLCNHTIMCVQAADSPVNIIERVERYTSHFDKEEINLYLEKGEYQTAKALIEQAKDGYQERWDYTGLTTNDMYISYQFKEYMTDGFFSRGWWASVTTWFSGLFYNDELKEYLALQSPGVNKYKEMLISFMNETMDDLVCKEYIKELKYSLENIGETTEYVNNTGDLFSDIFKNIDIDTYDILYDMFSEAGSKEDIDRAVLNFVDDNFEFFNNESKIYLFKSNLEKLGTKLSNTLSFLGAGIEYIDTTISGIMEIDFFIANVDVLSYYDELLKNIQYTKYDNGDFIAPEDLRIAAKELQQELENKFSHVITNIINEYGVTTAMTGVEVLDLLGGGILGEILLGIDVGTMLGNITFDMESLVKGVSYVQGYAYLGEIYSIVLEEDKEVFLNKKSEENAEKFRKDYEILWNIRLNGENAYIDMSDFSETWDKDNQKLLRFWTDYENKNQFINNNIEMIENFRFKNPDFIQISEPTTIQMGKDLNKFLSVIYQNGIRNYDSDNYDISILMDFVYNFPVEGASYESEGGDYFYVVPYDNVNKILKYYFGIVAPQQQINDILYQDEKYYFPVKDYGEIGLSIVIVNNIKSINNEHKMEFDIVYIWPENFNTGELNPVEDWNEYYKYNMEQMKNDKFCEIIGYGDAVITQNQGDIYISKFHTHEGYSTPLTEDEAYEKAVKYWESLGKPMPENIEYEGMTEYGYCFWGYDMYETHGVTSFRICVDPNTGRLFNFTKDEYIQ